MGSVSDHFLFATDPAPPLYQLFHTVEKIARHYVPQHADAFLHHDMHHCGQCPHSFAYRDLLQLHKKDAHGLIEILLAPPGSGNGDLNRDPVYFRGNSSVAEV